MKKLCFIIACLCLHIGSYAQVPEKDSLALVALYNALDGPHWTTSNTNWLQPGKKVDDWAGITVNHDRVRVVLIGGPSIKGRLPEEIGDLTAISTFAITGGNLSGPLPASIVNWRECFLFDLESSGYSGEIAAQLFQLLPSSIDPNRVRQVVLIDNNITGIDFKPTPGYNLHTLLIENNRLDFADIEPIVAFMAQMQNPDFSYAPQRPLYTTVNLTLRANAKLTLTTEAGGSVNQYQWLKNNTPMTGTSATQKTYSFDVTTAHDGDVYTAQVTNNKCPDLTLERNPVTLTVVPHDFVYLDCTAGSIQVSAGTNDPNAKILWSNGATTHDITVTASGKYGVHIEGDGYTVEDTVEVALPATLTLGGDINSCQPTVVLTSNIPNADAYIWQTPDGEIQGPSSITASVNGPYSLTIKKGICTDKMVNINVLVGNITPGAFEMQAGTAPVEDGGVALANVPLSFVNTTGTGKDYSWSFGDVATAQGDEAIHQYTKAGDYTITLTGTDNRNCPVTAEKHITIQDILITTAITPNGNGKNDKWYVEPFIYNAALKIVDRKGKTVYSADPYNDDFTGHNLSEGIYYYELYLKEIDKRYKGYVHIIKK